MTHSCHTRRSADLGSELLLQLGQAGGDAGIAAVAERLQLETDVVLLRGEVAVTRLLVDGDDHVRGEVDRSEAHTSELQSLMRISYAVFCLKKQNTYLHVSTYFFSNTFPFLH